jgi:hypothetical protein
MLVYVMVVFFLLGVVGGWGVTRWVYDKVSYVAPEICVGMSSGIPSGWEPECVENETIVIKQLGMYYDGKLGGRINISYNRNAWENITVTVLIKNPEVGVGYSNLSIVNETEKEEFYCNKEILVRKRR